MKKGSDNHRSAAVIDIISKLILADKKIIIFEPQIKESSFLNCEIINNLEEFKSSSQIIITNRMSPDIDDVKDKVFTRDIFNRDQKLKIAIIGGGINGITSAWKLATNGYKVDLYEEKELFELLFELFMNFKIIMNHVIY